jgi:hypothetical protein
VPDRLDCVRVGRLRRQIIGPQREKAARQIVCFAHPRNYNSAFRAAQHGDARRPAFDAANPAIRCIVAAQHLSLNDRQGA